MNVSEISAKRLHDSMRDANISLSELSRRTGINKSTISHYMHGKFSPKHDSAEKMASVLGVHPAWLMGVSEVKSPYRSVGNIDLMAKSVDDEGHTTYRLIEQKPTEVNDPIFSVVEDVYKKLSDDKKLALLKYCIELSMKEGD